MQTTRHIPKAGLVIKGVYSTYSTANVNELCHKGGYSQIHDCTLAEGLQCVYCDGDAEDAPRLACLVKSCHRLAAFSTLFLAFSSASPFQRSCSFCITGANWFPTCVCVRAT